MTINVNTKIAALLKQSPGSLETIVSLSPRFSKLRNPLLRKIMAGRTSIAMAAKAGGCTTDDFFNALQPLGFDIDKATVVQQEPVEKREVPGFMQKLQPGKVDELDVRASIEAGNDPLSIILLKVESLQKDHVLKIINSFEPTPLMKLLGKQGFQSYAETINDELVYTYFYREDNNTVVALPEQINNTEGWDCILNRFSNKMDTVDVRFLEMPLPMHTILNALETLSPGRALFVYHKRIPVFLLPELEERKFSYRVKEISETEIQLLIYKD